jgi:16S rRNA (adenine1518-N6/adenine1519-N6)-dimethyltransferase
VARPLIPDDAGEDPAGCGVAAPVFNPDSPAEIRAVLEQLGIGLKKRWGQNFLVNRGARERLVALLDPQPGELAWEIGPGLGSMTGMLLERGVRLTAFEVDRGLCRFLRQAHAQESRFNLVEGDFLETWETAAAGGGAPARLLGNLPYRSASLMIVSIIEGGLRPSRLVFTVQRELADRMTASPRSKDYSSFSALCQACFAISGKGDLRPGSFYPAPGVVSSIVEMQPLPSGPDGRTVAALSGLLRGLFAARRKTLRNNVQSGWADGEPRAAVAAALEAEGIDLSSRAEEIPPAVFLRLARRLVDLSILSSSP